MSSRTDDRRPAVRRVFIDHLRIPVRDLAASRAFYEAALAPFGGNNVEAVFHGP